jgi:pimeloyl-ACP methyl ester carboxylesterase
MAEKAQEWTEERAPVAGTELVLVKGGAGRPLVVFHDELGHPGWLRWHSALAGDRLLLIPLQPGFGKSPRLDWIMSVHDLAAFYSRVLREMGLVPVDVIGFSFGGWVAAEMAANNAQQFRRMVLVAPAGIRPPRGEIEDVFINRVRDYLDASVLKPSDTPEYANLYGGLRATPEQFEAWEDARAEVARLAWAPYLANLSLPHLLEGLSGLPTLLVWGAQDRIVPLSAGEVYRKSIAGAELVVFDQCGHHPEIEKSSEFISLVRQFIV